MANSFRLYRTPGPPGRYHGYLEIDGVKYKLHGDASGKGKAWRLTGSVTRDAKQDQLGLPLDRCKFDPSDVPF